MPSHGPKVRLYHWISLSLSPSQDWMAGCRPVHKHPDISSVYFSSVYRHRHPTVQEQILDQQIETKVSAATTTYSTLDTRSTDTSGGWWWHKNAMLAYINVCTRSWAGDLPFDVIAFPEDACDNPIWWTTMDRVISVVNMIPVVPGTMDDEVEGILARMFNWFDGCIPGNWIISLHTHTITGCGSKGCCSPPSPITTHFNIHSPRNILTNIFVSLPSTSLSSLNPPTKRRRGN